MWKSDEGKTVSYWQASEDGLQNESLGESIETDVCIIGGGISGLTTEHDAAGGILRETRQTTADYVVPAGTLITLEAEIEHEVVAEPEIHILVTKFKEE